MPLPIYPGQASDECKADEATEPCEPNARLAALDRRKVAVHIHIKGREQLVLGVGDYGEDPDLGGVLRVQPSNSREPELLFVEQLWTGTIRRGHALGCDYLIHLG
jgi:hypothetical protein